MSRLFCVAGEASGDLACSQLIEAVRPLAPALEIQGIGGRRMQRLNIPLWAVSTHWGAVGVTHALRLAPALAVMNYRLRSYLARYKPDCLLLVDFGAFNVPLGRWARRHQIPVLYYFPPGSWRRKPRKGRLRDAADLVITPFSWSAEGLREQGMQAEWLGHPLLDWLSPSEGRDVFRSRLGASDAALIGILPGSRRHEVESLLPYLVKAARLLIQEDSKVRFVVGRASSIEVQWLQRRLASIASHCQISDQTHDVMAHSDLVWCCSGTATLETAVLGTPLIIVYQGPWALRLEWLLRRRQMPVIGLPNLLAGQRIVPELLGESSPTNLLMHTKRLFSGPERDQQLAGLRAVKALLGQPGATQRAARRLVQFMDDMAAAS